MAENIIKDFVKKQTSPINISVPKARPVVQPEEKSVNDLSEDPRKELKEGMTTVPVKEEKKLGRPRSGVEKVKLSLYVQEDIKQKLIRIQHTTCKASLNDVLTEAVSELLKKYGM